MGELEGRVALITGSASGIGKAIAECFAKESAAVIIADIDLPSAEKLANTIIERGGKALPVSCDVTNSIDVEHAVQQSVHVFGGLQILVNNAGISPLRSLEDISLAEWEQVMKINLTGPFLIIKEVLPYIINAGHFGRVINMGSLAGQMGGISVGLHYTASKGGLMAMTKQLAKLLAPYRATANSIAPGTTDTPLVQGWPPEARRELVKKIPLGRLAEPSDIAGAALFLASDSAEFITGATINVNGGMFIG